MATGVKVDDECVTAFNSMKLGKDAKYIIFDLSADSKNIVVLKKGAADASFDAFLAELPKDDTRYGAVDFHYEGTDGPRNKLVFVVWSPESSKIKRKMLFAGSKATLKDKLVGLSFEIQATDLAEISTEAIVAKANSISK